MQNFIVSRCLVTEEIAEQIKSEHRTQNIHRQLYIILASYPFNLERKKYIYLFPMKPDEKNGFRAKNGF